MGCEGVLQYVTVCCSVLLCIAVCYSVSSQWAMMGYTVRSDQHSTHHHTKDNFADLDSMDGIERSELPLFDMLSPHHRARLLREVAVGLLCEETPLPPDTPWHYAAYYALMHFAALTQVRLECDLDMCDHDMDHLDELRHDGSDAAQGASAVDQPAPAEEAASVPGGQSASPGEAAASSIFGPGGYEQWEVEEHAHDLANRAKAKHDKNANRARGARVTACDVNLTNEPGCNTIIQRQLQRMISGSSCPEDPVHHRDQERRMVKSQYVFQWRRLVLAMAQERCTLSLRDPRMLVLGSSANIRNYQKVWRLSMLQLIEAKKNVWQDFYCLFYMTLHAWPGGQSTVRLWGSFLFGSLDRSRDTARYDLVVSQAKKASKIFAGQWCREGSILDIRILAVLMEPSDPENRFHWTFMADACRILDESKQHHSVRAFQLVQMSDEAFAALLEEKVSSVPPLDSYRLRPWGWAHQWHALLGRDHRGYSSTDARVDAVLHLDLALRRCAGDVLHLSGGDLHLWGLICEGDGPSSWSTLDCLLGNSGYSSGGSCCDNCNSKVDTGSKLMTCAGCGVTKYCSKECQRAG